jgi:4'-phosphopantetheinyl transferase
MREMVAWSSSAREIQLAENEVHVWRVKLDSSFVRPGRFSADLSEEEKLRATRFVLARDRSRFIVARSILRRLLGSYLGRPPASVAIELGPHGKPRLKSGLSFAPIGFNLSHSHGLVLYAFALQCEVGIDVEQIRPEVVNEGIEDSYFSVQEKMELNALPQELRHEGFFSCWTRKEAYVKAGGQGLQMPLNSFDVSLTPGRTGTLRSGDKGRWSLYSFCPEPGFAAALVIEGRASHLKFWEWRDTERER